MSWSLTGKEGDSVGQDRLRRHILDDLKIEQQSKNSNNRAWVLMPNRLVHAGGEAKLIVP